MSESAEKSFVERIEGGEDGPNGELQRGLKNRHAQMIT